MTETERRHLVSKGVYLVQMTGPNGGHHVQTMLRGNQMSVRQIAQMRRELNETVHEPTHRQKKGLASFQQTLPQDSQDLVC